ncbi:MAG: hypothetical protein IJP66_03075 [Kiritimatiellae bacterium]|nr:hypothetical protein [Kiritimatiellia bacterium]
MNKLVTRHSSFGGRAAVIRGVAASVIALAATAASARTVSVAAIRDGAATAAFGDPDGAAYTLAWGYGPADGGAATNAWEHFETLDAVAADAVTTSVPLPAGWGDTVTHLRFFLLEPELPAAATRVEYLQAAQNKDSPTQWIDTGIAGKVGVEAEVDFVQTAGSDSTILGSRKTSGDTRFLVLHWNGSKIGSALDTWTSFGSLSAAAASGTRYVARASLADGAQSLSIDGTTKATGTAASSLDTGYNMYLFAANIYGTAKQGISAKIYSAKIWLDGDLKRDFVPCLDADSKPAMYDRVSKGYFYNGGAGTFSTPDPMATPLLVAASSDSAAAADYGEPDAYLDYVEATGSQYIDTGVKAQSGLKARLDLTISADTGDRSFLDARHGDLRFMMCHHVSHKAFAGHGTGDAHKTTVNSPLVPTDVRFEYLCDYSDGSAPQIYLDGTNILSSANQTSLAQTMATSDVGDLTLYLFACNYDGTPSWHGRGKLHGCKILLADGNGGFDVVRHYLPARKNGVAGLYDKVSNRFSPSATATAFGAPDDNLPRPVELVEWVRSDGARGSRKLWIDTGVIAKSGLNSDIDFILHDVPTTGNSGDNDRGILASKSSGDTRFYLAYHYKTNFVYGYQRLFHDGASSANEKANVIAAVNGERYRIVSDLSAGSQSVTVNGAELHKDGVPYKTGYFTTGQSLSLFCYSNDGTPSLFSSVQLYLLRIADGDEPLRDFVPCVADNGRAGLYDRVSERVFFPQAAVEGATAAFDPDTEVGAVTNSLVAVAEPPKRLRYIESDGTGDYIDLGVTAKDGTRMVAEMEWSVLPDDDVFCGARVALSGTYENTRFFLYNAYGSSPLHAMGYAGGNATVGDAGYVKTGVRYRIETTLESGAQTCSVRKFVDGVWSDAATRTSEFAGPLDTGIPLYLFARNLGGTPDLFSAARVYSLQFWQKDGSGEYALVRDLVPARLDSGAAVLWDKVEARPYYNAARYGFAATGRETAWNGASFVIRFW